MFVFFNGGVDGGLWWNCCSARGGFCFGLMVGRGAFLGFWVCFFEEGLCWIFRIIVMVFEFKGCLVLGAGGGGEGVIGSVFIFFIIVIEYFLWVRIVLGFGGLGVIRTG